MYKFNKILVGLDLSSLDEELISATSDICELSGSKEVFFINVLRDFNIPEELLKEFPDIVDKAIEERKKDLQREIDEFFLCKEGSEINVNVIVQKGQFTKTLMKFISEHKIDLIVLGRKDEKKSGGVVVSRVARKVGCSLLILPKGSRFSLKNILIPTDFSDYSLKAMEKATTLARRSKTNERVIVQNVYQVPAGYHYTGKSYKEFAEIMKSNAKKDYQRFISAVNTKDIKLEELYTLDKDDDIITDIYKTAKKLKADIIVIGAKGRTSTAAILIGSKTERLVQLNTEIPMLVVRPKGKVAGFLQSIQDL